MSVTSQDLHRALHAAMEGHALNQIEARLLFNPEVGTESLATHILSLRYLGLPAKVISGLLQEIKQIMQINEEEAGCHTQLTGQLDRLAHALHHAECNNPGHQALGIKAIARVLRAPLQQLPGADGITYYRAAAAIRDVIASTTHEQLRAPSLRHELGTRAHDRLVAFLDACQDTRS